MNALQRIFSAVLLTASIGAATAHADDAVVGLGAFEGRSGHVTTGGVTVERTDDGYQLVLDQDFELDGAPDPRIGFGSDGFVEGTDFTPLHSNAGEQTYLIPASIDPTEFSEVYIWCGEFSVALGVAPLQ